MERHELFSSKPAYTPVAAQDGPAKAHRGLNGSWRGYWKTPALMLTLYMLAWIIALIHLALFLALNGKSTEDSIPQNYVSALSQAFTLSFRAALCSSLVVAFTQHLWRSMRLQAIRIGTIENLFNLTQNFLLLLIPAVVKAAPVLTILALFSWTVPIAVIFPPGALIVVPRTVHNATLLPLPIYNGSSLGNASQADAELTSLAIRHLSGGQWAYVSASPLIRRYGRLVLELDTITPTASPCGADCEFDLQFEGPYLQCNTSTTNVTQGFLPADTCLLLAFDTSIWSEGSRNVFGAFNMSVTSNTGLTSNRSVWQTFQNLTCMPSRASHDAHAVYRGGNLSVSHTEEYIGSLTDMNHLIDGYYPVTPQCDALLAANGSGTDAYYDCVEYEPAQWSEPLRQVLTSLNHFALIDSVISPLAGNYSMSTSGHFTAGAGSFTACGPKGGSIVADTRLNLQRDNFRRTPDAGPEFNVTQDMLNDLLFDLTMSAALQLGIWSLTVPTNITSTHQVYDFKYPRSLLGPYLACLLLSVPFLALGLRSLHLNGVSAIDGSFVQILMTTTGSKRLEHAAAQGCLGGYENVPRSLQETRIRFGELETFDEFAYKSGNDQPVSRAGFGLEGEVRPLRRGVRYGV